METNQFLAESDDIVGRVQISIKVMKLDFNL